MHQIPSKLEIFPIVLAPEGFCWLKPAGEVSLRVDTNATEQPGDTVLHTLDKHEIVPMVTHSTSWRTDNGHIVLTYVAVVHALPKNSNFEIVPIGHVNLARGEATEAPQNIAVEQVIEHGLRHLAWLSKDDLTIARLLAGWADALSGYSPEPSRAF